ncbi:MAG: cupin domain-containing protein [Anaerolineae bacterium]|nr:cupin domain-containing protein [Anaerolineae bacterium]
MIVKRETLAAIDFNGLTIYDYTAGKETSSSFATILVPPGVRHAEAWSKRSDKYYYVISGQVAFALDGAEVNLCAGDFCLVRRGQRFWYENQAEETAILILVHTPNFDLASEVFV